MNLPNTCAPDAPPFQLLDSAPEARTVRVEDLLAEVSRGRIRVPEFQRLFQWERDDARDLLDSIYRGYPIGTLLLWQTSAEAQRVSFGPVEVAAPARSDAWWVVDGQQRVGSLTRVLLASDPSLDDFSLYFDLDRAIFVPASTAARSLPEDPSRWLPLAVVHDSEKQFQWMLSYQPEQERRNLAISVGRRIREYAIPAYIVRTENEATLREIFGRTNTGGKPLKPDQVFEALHSARSSNKPSRISDIAEDLQALGFGQVETKILFRLLRVLAGADVTEQRGERGGLRLSSEQAQVAYARTAAAARAAVQFLQVDAGIPHYDLLPYKQPLVTLGKFFHLHPDPSNRSKQLLGRWLWRGAINGAHRGDTVSTRIALDQIQDDDEEKSVQRLLRQVSAGAPSWPSARKSFNFRFAYGKLQILALAAFGPRDLTTGQPIHPASLFNMPSDELPLPDIFGNAKGDLAHSVTNRILHPRQVRIRSTLASMSDPRILESHGISEEAQSALALGQVDRFLDLRAQMLEKRFGEFFERKMQWHETDRPSLPALVVLDDD